MKKMIILLFSAVMLFSGCSAEKESESTPDISSVSEKITETGTETEKEDELSTSEIVSENIKSISEESANDESGYFSKPSKEFLDSAFSNENSHSIIKYTKDGKYAILSDEESDKLMYRELYKNIFTEEKYQDYKEYAEKDISFDEYCSLMKEWYGVDPEELENENEEPFVLFDISVHSNKACSSVSKTAFLHMIELLNSDDSRISEIQNSAGISPEIYIVMRLEEYEDDIIKMRAGYSYGYEDVNTLFNDEYISASGRNITNISGYPVYSDCKSLYLSAYDNTAGSMLDNGESGNYDNVIFNFGEDGNGMSIDIAEIAEKLPDLEKLYLSYYITLENASAISELKNLKELNISVSDESDLKALEGISVKELSVSDINFPAGALENVNADELVIDCTGNTDVLKSIFKLKNVASLTIDRFGESEYQIDGISALSDLKKLDIRSSGMIDLAPLEKLDSLEDLEIMSYHTKNLDKISGLKNVRKLMLHSIDDDLSFLSKMTQLEELRLMYVNSSFNSSLGNLKNLRSLSLSDISGTVDYEEIYDNPKLEYLSFMGIDISTRGISKAKNLERLNIMLCYYGDLSELKKCDKLSELIIYNNETPYFDAKDIEGMTQLETLKFNCSEIDNYESLKTLTGLKLMYLFFCDLSSEEIEDLRKSLPDCEIALDTD